MWVDFKIQRLQAASWLVQIPVIKMFYPQLAAGIIAAEEQPKWMPAFKVVDVELQAFLTSSLERSGPQWWRRENF